MRIGSLTREETLFVFFSMIVGFCISFEYGIVRPASQSIFLSVFSAHAYPAIWLATVPLNFTIIYLYNRFIPKIGPLKMLYIVTLAVMGISTICGFVLPSFPQLIFFHFCWKDIYILLLFQQLWSMIHSTIPSDRAKYLYGAIFAVGTVGAIFGSLLPGFLATLIGSTRLFFFTVPVYSLLTWAYSRAYSLSGARNLTALPVKETSAANGFKMIKESRYLLGILLLVVLMQLTVALVEYQFGHILETEFPVQDVRTAVFGKLISVINLTSLGLQFVGGFLLLGLLGLRGSHFLVPVVLCLAALGQWFSPGLAMASAVFVITKSIDYSLFGVVREMLFIPLKLDEKFRAKAVIDVFAYRTSKAFASFLILSLEWFVGAAVFQWTSYLSFAVFGAWIIVVSLLFFKYQPTALALSDNRARE